MEREHLIIIALILVALYMMNSSSSKDKVKAIGPAGRIRYGECPGGSDPPCSPLGHIRTRREGFMQEGQDSSGINQSSVGPQQRIRLGDRDWGHSQHIKNHIRYDNRNNMFSGMMEGCAEKFRFTGADGPQDSAGKQ